MKKIILILLLFLSTTIYSQSSIAEEAGYILAQQVAVTGLSYLANQEKIYGHLIVGALDLFFAFAGVQNGFVKEKNIQKIGYMVISAGFAAKGAYTAHYGKNDSDKKRFWTNFIAFNTLMYSGYLLDTLSEPTAG
ncbi:MAG: hypothetical protein QF418_00775 [Candidatus Marinimicrobia bacterium]|jgi:hypothetical protein|nr:hypothetical protein [Candidatus Neomarinimicrobiota bacterium]|tara:strand:- start:621 stop:1025 length:405 start_codon:yes stop_codon:yes gene_type:complete